VEQLGKTIAIAKSGLADAGFNMAFVLEKPDSLTERLSQAIRRVFVRSNTPWELITTPQISPDLNRVIEEFQLVKRAVEPGMLLENIPDFLPSPPPGFEVRQVSQREEIQTFLKVGMLGFGNPSGNILQPLADGLTDNKSSFRGGCYLGYVNELPVATSIRVSVGQVAEIYFVATLPEFRKRGYGEAMTRRAVWDGKKNDGCTCALLEASEMGRPIYEKMGFEKIIDYEIWKS